MAQCQINILSGTVLIRYNLAGTDNEIQADSGDPVWIDDSATDVTWSPLTVGATATSSCISLTLLPVNCYLYSWEFNRQVISCYNNLASNSISDYEFSDIVISPTTHDIENLPYTTPTALGLADKINSLNNKNFKAVAYKNLLTTNKTQLFLIIKSFVNTIPEIKLTSLIGGHSLYIKGILSTECLPSGFISINIC